MLKSGKQGEKAEFESVVRTVEAELERQAQKAASRRGANAAVGTEEVVSVGGEATAPAPAEV